MANNETLGASFSIDVTNLKAGLAQANRMIRESESEFKAAAAGMDDWSSSSDGLNAKIKSLNGITQAQGAKVAALKTEYERLIADGLDPTSAQAVELRTKINNETAALNKNEQELKKQKQALEDLGKESAEAGEATEDMGGKFEGLKAAGGIAVKAIAAVGAACVAAVGAFLGLAESTREARNNMAKLETSFETAGLSAENAENTFTELYSVLGDEGKATEASQHLAKISKDEEDLAANTRILTGVMAEWGESIPTEGLAEGMAATASMGEVQGVLADALEWQGVNLEEYNAKLAELATEEERAAYIQSTLTDLYGASADAYRENNAEVIAAQKAQADMNAAINELGAIAEPIMTTLKTLATDLLTTLTPFVALIGNGLSGALSGAEGAADTLASGLNGVITTLLNKIVAMLPFVVEAIVAIVPKLITSLLQQLPSILNMLIDVVTQIIDAIAEMLPTIVTAVMDVLPKLINALLAAIPQLLQAAVKLLMAIVDAIPVIVVALLNALPWIVKTLITSLVSSIPILLDAAIQLLTAIVDAIPVILDALIENLPSIIDTIITGLLDALPMLLEAAITLLFAIVEAIPTIVSALFTRLPQIIGAILTSLKNAIPKVFNTAKELLGKIIDAVGNLVRELPSKVKQINSAIVDGLKAGIAKIKDIGGDIVKGLWNGINDMGDWIGKKIKGFGEGVLGGIKDFFGIKSPSRVMADVIGKNLALGIGMGFEKNIAGVNDTITGAMDFAGSGGQVGNVGGATATGGGVVVYQTNNYSQAHSRLELYKSKQATAAAVRLALTGA